MGWPLVALAAASAYSGYRQSKDQKDAAKDAREAQEGQNEYAQRYAQQQTRQGRQDINTLYGAADQARNDAYSRALNMQTHAMPIQARYFQGGNMAAQRAILGGQPFTWQAPQVNPDYLRQPAFQMPTWEQPDLEYVPMLGGRIEHRTPLGDGTENVGIPYTELISRTLTAVGQDPTEYGLPPSQWQPGNTPSTGGYTSSRPNSRGGNSFRPGNGDQGRGEPPYPGAVWQGRFGRWV